MGTLNFIKESLRADANNLIGISRYIKKELRCNIYNSSLVLPLISMDGIKGGVVDKQGFQIKASSIEQIKDIYTYNPCKIEKKHSAILVSVFTTFCYGHCITDHFSKLWFLNTKEFKTLLNEGAELIYISTNNIYPPKYLIDLFLLAGVNLNNLKCVTEVTEYEKLYIPEDSFFSTTDRESRFYTDEYKQTIESVKKNVTLLMENSIFTVFPAIYLTRTHGKYGGGFREFGEKRIEKIFSENYNIIAPEEFSVTEQIWLLMNANEIITTEGSIAHSTVFCKPHTKLTLIRKCNWISIHQLVVNELAELDVTYVDANFSCFCDKNGPWHGPFYLYITKYLEKYVGKQIKHIPYWCDYIFFIYCARGLYTKYLKKIRVLDSFIKNHLLNI